MRLLIWEKKEKTHGRERDWPWLLLRVKLVFSQSFFKTCPLQSHTLVRTENCILAEALQIAKNTLLLCCSMLQTPRYGCCVFSGVTGLCHHGSVWLKGILPVLPPLLKHKGNYWVGIGPPQLSEPSQYLWKDDLLTPGRFYSLFN